MRLIDADSIYKFSLKSLERLDKPLDYLDGWNEAIDALEDKAPTVDAIPIEWIKKYEKTDDLAASIYRMLEEWENAEFAKEWEELNNDY